MPAARIATLVRQAHRTRYWISLAGGRPTDTIYANPFIADVNGTRMFFSAAATARCTR